MSNFQVISPVDGSIYTECQLHTAADIEKALASAGSAQKVWRNLSVAERKPYIEKFINSFQSLKEKISEELSWQMGRPISHSPFEVRGTIERATGMLNLAEKSLSDVLVENLPVNRII